jgi:two-component system phosphate regulon response regulator PhoB
MTTILVVDDDPAIREMLQLALTRGGYIVQLAGSALEARDQLSKQTPDLILLDWMLPGQSGFDFARHLRRNPVHKKVPVIMLTARDQAEDKVAALDAGADDYVSKPFSIIELQARIKAVLRRSSNSSAAEVMEIGTLRLDRASHRVSINGAPLELAPMEYQLLLFFMTHRERVYSRQQLISLVWGAGAYVEDRTVDVHIRRLRKAMEPSGNDQLIQTVRGSGYRFSTQQ